MIEQLNIIFRELFLDESLTLTDTTTADDIDGWDSFTHLNVIMSIESHYGISITDEEIPTLRNVGDMMILIEKKLTEMPPSMSA
jgi:acyl carrier protein